MNVLIALDGSPDSQQALALAEVMLAGKQAVVTLIHVLPCLYYFGEAGPMPLACIDVDEQRIDGEVLLGAAVERLQRAGVGPTLKTFLKSGDPAEEILSLAQDEHADLILLGSHGHYAAQRFLLGSVSSEVSQYAHCPVVVARAGRRPVAVQHDVQRQTSLIN